MGNAFGPINLPSFSIATEKMDYEGGENLKGVVQIEVHDRPFICSNLYVHIIGETSTKIADKSGATDFFMDRNQFLDSVVHVTSMLEGKLKPGFYKFPFSAQLPPGIPSSCYGKETNDFDPSHEFKVDYQMALRMDIPDKAGWFSAGHYQRSPSHTSSVPADSFASERPILHIVRLSLYKDNEKLNIQKERQQITPPSLPDSFSAATTSITSTEPVIKATTATCIGWKTMNVGKSFLGFGIPLPAPDNVGIMGLQVALDRTTVAPGERLNFKVTVDDRTKTEGYSIEARIKQTVTLATATTGTDDNGRPKRATVETKPCCIFTYAHAKVDEGMVTDDDEEEKGGEEEGDGDGEGAGAGAERGDKKEKEKRKRKKRAEREVIEFNREVDPFEKLPFYLPSTATATATATADEEEEGRQNSNNDRNEVNDKDKDSNNDKGKDKEQPSEEERAAAKAEREAIEKYGLIIVAVSHQLHITVDIKNRPRMSAPSLTFPITLLRGGERQSGEIEPQPEPQPGQAAEPEPQLVGTGATNNRGGAQSCWALEHMPKVLLPPFQPEKEWKEDGWEGNVYKTYKHGKDERPPLALMAPVLLS